MSFLLPAEAIHKPLPHFAGVGFEVDIVQALCIIPHCDSGCTDKAGNTTCYMSADLSAEVKASYINNPEEVRQSVIDEVVNIGWLVH